LEATHNPLLYKRIKEFIPKRHFTTRAIKDKLAISCLNLKRSLIDWHSVEKTDDNRREHKHNMSTQEVFWYLK